MEEKVVKFYSIILLIFLLAVTIYLLSSYSFSLNNRVLIVNETKNNDLIIIFLRMNIQKVYQQLRDPYVRLKLFL